ncbi:MAG: hypothetical protein B6245_14695 [Desulfobacteraceae bacterium 4572_88]|nr:MAG: hypothetical protein B6245_14695 [Desulfobacteraceae bacterium 4572_88]RLC08667.1 MAG: hypothetical protein DRI57_23565 [Deltaproteobacteria bacterium]
MEKIIRKFLNPVNKAFAYTQKAKTRFPSHYKIAEVLPSPPETSQKNPDIPASDTGTSPTCPY